MRSYRNTVVLSLLVLLLALVVTPALAQSPTLIVGDDPILGKILTDAEGMTLYMFANDTPNTSNCTGACLTNWPPLLVTGTATKGDGISGTVGTIALADGTNQVVYNDMPLYHFAGDASAGDANGQAVNEAWYAVHPDAPSVTVADQAIENDTVTIGTVVAAGPSWLVVHAEADGKPGPVIGHAAVVSGWNDNVMVTIDPAQATQTLFAMLHVDRGTVGTYEFPGADVPVTLGGNVVAPSFFITGGLQAGATPASATTEATATVEGTATIEATATVEGTATAEATATVETTAPPAVTGTPAATVAAAAATTVMATATPAAVLPVSGGSPTNWAWVLAAIGGMLLLGGAGMRRAVARASRR